MRRSTVWSVPAAAQALAGVTVQIADLPGMMLGETIGNKILIDRDARGLRLVYRSDAGGQRRRSPTSSARTTWPPATAVPPPIEPTC